jgi:hypothetical protein
MPFSMLNIRAQGLKRLHVIELHDLIQFGSCGVWFRPECGSEILRWLL